MYIESEQGLDVKTSRLSRDASTSVEQLFGKDFTV